jgi:hypothetical protein
MKLLPLAILLAPAMSLAQPLTPADTAAGWKILFDGKTSTGWRGYKQDKFPATGWVIEDGCIKSIAGAAADIMTEGKYADFELELEWKASPKGNSGICYRVAEKHDASWQTGPEFQILDDTGYGASPTDMHAAGACYELAAPMDTKILKPAGEFNQARIILRDGLLTHFLNGAKVAQCRIDTQDWKDRIAKSKFKEYDGFGVQPTGHIAIQHHGNDMWFRNIRIRDLDAPMPGEKQLFNGNNFEGWTAILPSGGKLEDVWSVAKDTIGSPPGLAAYPGVIIECKGTPAGYIRTTGDYTNYVLQLDWRFNPAKGPGNSGVLLRQIGEDKVWPRSIEAQLESGNAGDFWNIDKFTMTADPKRTNGRNTKRPQGPGGSLERPLGEWNHYEIICDGGTVTLKVNGEVTNVATACEVVPGKICLQSEGTEIHFKDVKLAPIGKQE